MPGPTSESLNVPTVRASVNDTVCDVAVAPATAHELLRAVIDHMPVMLLVAGPDGTAKLMNREVERVLGWTAAEWAEPVHSARAYPDPEEAAAARAALRAADGMWRDARMTARDGQVRHTSWSHVRLSDGTTVAIGQDVTGRRLLEEQLRQAGKLEALGQLAGGVAHDFNNLLTVILGHLGLAQSALPPDARARAMLEQARQAAEQAAELTRHLLGFARRQPPRPAACRLATAVDETVRLLRRTVDPRVTFSVRHSGNGIVRADIGQIKQVLLNLCLNARDAMPEGGKLTLETADVVLPEPAGGGPPGRHGGAFVRLRVADTGAGMTPEIQARLFEPFFTTKPGDQGTGLGLSLVHAIVRKHGGWIECKSAPGRGTRFDIYLPRGAGTGASATRPTPLAEPARGTETILLIDDERMIRDLGQSFLEMNGYRVLLAADGDEAVMVFARSAGSIALVVLDLSLPKLSGREVLRQLRALNPDVRVLIASGFAPERLDPAERAAVAGHIAKPYRPVELAQAVRAALDLRAPTGGARVSLDYRPTPPRIGPALV